MLSYPWMLANALRQLPKGLISLKIVSSEADLSLPSQLPPINITMAASDSLSWKNLFPSLETLHLVGGPKWDENDLLQLPASLRSLHFERRSPPESLHDVTCLMTNFSYLPRGLTSLHMATADFDFDSINFSQLPPGLTSLLGFSQKISILYNNPEIAKKVLPHFPQSLTASFFYCPDLSASTLRVLPPSLTKLLSSATTISAEVPLPSTLTSLDSHIQWTKDILVHLPPTLQDLDCHSIDWEGLFSTYRAEISDLREMASTFDFTGRLPQGRVLHPDHVTFAASLAAKKPRIFPASLKKLCLQRDLPQKAAYLLPSSVVSIVALGKILDKRWTARYGLLLPKLNKIHFHMHSPTGDAFEAVSFLTCLEGSSVKHIFRSMRTSLAEGVISRFPRNVLSLNIHSLVLLASEIRFLPPLLETISVFAINMDHGVSSELYGGHIILNAFPKTLKSLAVATFHDPDNGSAIWRFDDREYDYEAWCSNPETVLTAECFQYLPPHLTRLAISDQCVPVTALNHICALPITDLSIKFDGFNSAWWHLVPATITALDLDAPSYFPHPDELCKLPPYLERLTGHMTSLASKFGQAIREKRKAPQATPDDRVTKKLDQC